MTSLPNEIERGGDYLYRGVKYTRTDLIPAMICEAVEAERDKLIKDVLSSLQSAGIYDDNVYYAIEYAIERKPK